MIVCRKCSRRHPDGTEFCDCGAYLSFDGEHVAEPTAAGGPAAPAADPRTPPPPPAAQAWGAVEPGAAQPGRRVAAEPAPWSGLPGQTTAGPTSDVDARLPDAPMREAAAPIWVEPSGRAGDIACPRCHVPNDPDRQFCKHCGNPLGSASSGAIAVGGAVASAVPWWRRLGRSARAKAERADPSSMAMDARRLATPGGISSRVLMFRTGGIAVLAIGLLAFLGPWRHTVYSNAKTLLGGRQYVAIDHDAVTAVTVPVPGVQAQDMAPQVADNVLDRHANTAWATRWIPALSATATSPDPTAATSTTTAPAPTTTATAATSAVCGAPTGADTSLQFTFDQPTDIDRVEILAGRYAEDKSRTLYTRPRIIELTAGGRCQHYEVPDTGTLQAINFKAADVTQVDLRILDVYRDATSSATVEVSEVVFERQR